MSRISVCMIVKNEADNLPALLRSIEPLDAELVVVDTGSTDATVEIAKAAGAKVSFMEWRKDFALARNASLDRATRPWILWLDADDRLPPESVEPILRAAQDPPERALSFLIKNTIDGGATGSEFSQIRMFPAHPRLRFTGAIHEQVYPAIFALGLPLEYSQIMVHHTGYTDPATVKAKQVRNRAILQDRVAAGDCGAIQWYQMATSMQDLGEIDEAETGFRKALELVRAGDADQHLLSVLPSHLASLRLVRGDVQGAYDVYQETLDPDPASWHPNQISLVAQVWTQVLGAEAALEFWEKAFTPSVRQALLPVDPKLVSILPLQSLAEHWRTHGNEPLGLEILKILKDVLETRRPPRWVLPDAYVRHGKPARAAELYAWCIQKDGDDPRAWSGLVRALRMCSQEESADRFLRAGLEMWPDHPEFTDLRQDSGLVRA
ncbi:MAG TPA: glycosyltransferase [Fibrobacteria bacterium]|nr:glycosyltransferase [Fibrobacteria bacterium]